MANSITDSSVVMQMQQTTSVPILKMPSLQQAADMQGIQEKATVNWGDQLSLKNNIFAGKYRKNAIWQDTTSVKTSINIQPKVNTHISEKYDYSYFFVIAVFLLLIMAYIKTTFGKHFNLFSRALFFKVDANKLYQEQSAFVNSMLWVLNLNYIVVGFFGLLFFFYSNNPVFFKENFSIVLGWSAAIPLALFFYRYLSVKISGWLFRMQQAFDEYKFYALLYFKYTGIFIFIILSVLLIVDQEWYQSLYIFSFVVILLTYFLLVIKGIRILLKKGVLFFYLMLYLCTIEWLPMLLVYKYLKSL